MAASPLRAALLPAALAAAWIAALAAGGPESALDRNLLFAAQREALLPAARLVTRLGDGGVLLAATAAAAGALLLRRSVRAALLLLAVTLPCRLLVELQKMAFDRARPDPEGHQIAVHTMAFPSGHAANATAVLLAVALVAFGGTRLRLPALVVALILAFLIGASRVVLGVHWPSDVAGGWAFGAAWTLLLIRLAGGTSPAARH